MAQSGNICSDCLSLPAVLKRCLNNKKVCKKCFFRQFEAEIHHTITQNNLFKKGDKIAIGASGGKDSTVLIHILEKLNRKHSYGLDLVLLSIDEGITGYRDDSLETVERNKAQYKLPLKILSYEDLYKGWTMDKVVRETGKSNNCTFCGVFRRQALDRGAHLIGADMIATGHNADDLAETALMNIFRGDFNRLVRCSNIVTGSEGTMARCKPFKYAYQKEIVLYAYHKKLDYFSTECIYSPESYRLYIREFIKDLERERPSVIIDIIRSAEQMRAIYELNQNRQNPPVNINKCKICGYMCSGSLCKACVLLEGLDKGMAKISLGSKSRKLFDSRDPRLAW